MIDSSNLWRYAKQIESEVEKLLKDIEKFDGTIEEKQKVMKTIMKDVSTIEAWVKMTGMTYEQINDKLKKQSLKGCKTTRKPKRK